jgi:hypothetical protein
MFHDNIFIIYLQLNQSLIPGEEAIQVLDISQASGEKDKKRNDLTCQKNTFSVPWVAELAIVHIKVSYKVYL